MGGVLHGQGIRVCVSILKDVMGGTLRYPLRRTCECCVNKIWFDLYVGLRKIFVGIGTF